MCLARQSGSLRSPPLSTDFIPHAFRTPSSTMDDSYAPTTALVPVELFPRIASAALLTGFGATALFVAHQAIGTKKTRNVGRDVALAATASVMLGLGLVFSLLSNGIWL